MGSIVLKNCLVLHPGLETVKRDILITRGKIREVSEEVFFENEEIQILDMCEHYVMPGLIDCHTHLGIVEEATGKIGVDNNETSEPVTPQLRGIDAINPLDIAFRDALRTGVTCVMSGPGSNNAVGGQNAVIKTCGRIIDRMVVKSPAGLKIAFGENPISTYGKSSRCPVTRMGTASLIREMFMRAQDYMAQKKEGKIKERDIKLEAVIPVLTGEIPVRAHAHRADDIVTAIRIAEEFGIEKLVIEHGTEAHLVKDYIKEKRIPIAYGPVLAPRIKMELKERKYSSIPELIAEGIKVALITDHPYNSIDQLRTVAILALSEGLALKDAVKCITSWPAEIMECQDRIGKIEAGYDGDIAVFDGHPMEIGSKVIMTLIDGSVAYRGDMKKAGMPVR